MKTRVTWNLYSAVLLVNAYVAIKRDSKKRNQVILKLSQLLRGQIDKKKEIASDAYASTVDINQKLGKLECLLTDGQRGLPGVVLPCMEQAVDLYKNDREQYLLYKKAAQKHITLNQLKKQLAKKKAKEEKKKAVLPEVLSISSAAEGVDSKEALPLTMPVSELPLSGRIQNILKRNKITTLKEALDYPGDQWMQLKGMGAKTFHELSMFLETYKSGIQESSEESARAAEESMAFGLSVSYDTPIQKLDFGRGINEVLQKNRFRNLRDVLRYPREKWYDLPGLRVSLVEPLLESMEGYRQMARATAEKKRALENQDIPAEQLAEEARSLTVFADLISVTFEYVMTVLHDKKEDKRTIAEKLWEEERVQEAVKAQTLHWLKASRYEGLSLFALSQKFPALVFDDEIFSPLLKEMEAAGLIRLKNEVIFCVYPSIAEYLPSLEERERELLSRESPDEIAQRLGVTHEQVGQMQKDILEKLPLLEEGYWLARKERLSDLTDEDFQFIFQLPAETVRFLGLWGGHFPSAAHVTKEGRIHGLHQVLQDAETDAPAYERAQGRLQEIKSCFVIDGKRIPKKREALIRFIIKSYCQEPRTLQEIKDYYEGLRLALGEEASDPSFDMDVRGLEQALDPMSVLAGRGSRIRYYDILANDYGALLDGLDFSSYANVTVSARKFFVDSPELMEQYDIRTEGELYNLLKKLWDHGHYNDYADEEHQLTFARMPMLVFGKADRGAQVLQLLREHAPISYGDFTVLIEKEFGISKYTAISNWLPLVREYLVNGTYITNTSHLPKEQIDHMKGLLTEDFYLSAEIRDLYTEEFPEVNSWDIGTDAFYQMGFMLCGKYAVRSIYKNVTDFFEKLFAREDVVNLGERSELLLASACRVVAQKLQEKYEIVETEPGVFYHSRLLREKGITREAMTDFCNQVYDFASDEKCFTIHSLRRKGFVFPWADGRWSDWFYASLLSADKERFNCQRAGKTKILRRRKMQRKLSFMDLLEEITDDAAYMLTIDEIRQILHIKYGLDINSTKIKEVAQSDDMFEDRILY